MVALLRRFDFWVVVGFLLLGIGYWAGTQVLHQRMLKPPEVVQVVLDPAAPAAPAAPDAASEQLPFDVESVSWREEGKTHWLLEMKVRYRNDSEVPERLEPPRTEVITAQGEAVEPFFLAAAPVPEVAAKSEDTVELRYWVAEDQAREELWLQVDGQRARIEAPRQQM